LIKAHEIFSELLDAVRPLDGHFPKIFNGSSCSCPPSCSRTTYDPAITSASFPNPVSKVPNVLKNFGYTFKYQIVLKK